jgi:hypothetical protein
MKSCDEGKKLDGDKKDIKSKNPKESENLMETGDMEDGDR